MTPFIKTILLCQLVVFASLQYRLWLGESGVAQLFNLDQQIDEQQQENRILGDKNRLLMAEVDALRHDPTAIEERARLELGMVKPGETLYLLVK